MKMIATMAVTNMTAVNRVPLVRSVVPMIDAFPMPMFAMATTIVRTIRTNLVTFVKIANRNTCGNVNEANVASMLENFAIESMIVAKVIRVTSRVKPVPMPNRRSTEFATSVHPITFDVQPLTCAYQ